jgi:hypothetical protein
MAKTLLRAESACDNILTFTAPPRPLRADVPPFNPNDPAHLRAWEAMFDFARTWGATDGE